MVFRPTESSFSSYRQSFTSFFPGLNNLDQVEGKLKMVVTKYCTSNISLDVGSRIIIWTDVFFTVAFILSSVANYVYPPTEDSGTVCVLLSSLKLGILIIALDGINKNKPSHLLPYLIYKVVEIIAVITLVLLVIAYYDQLLKPHLDDFRFTLVPEYRAVFATWTRFISYFVAIVFIGGFSIWTYLTGVLYTHYKHLKDNVNNGSNDDSSSIYLIPSQLEGVTKCDKINYSAPVYLEEPPTYREVVYNA